MVYLDGIERPRPSDDWRDEVRFARLMQLVAVAAGIKNGGENYTVTDFLPEDLKPPKKVETPFERMQKVKDRMAEVKAAQEARRIAREAREAKRAAREQA